MTLQYCHLCGGKYQKGQQQPWQCSKCENIHYKNPRPTVGIALFTPDGKVLISERGAEPAKGKFNLPGGFVEPKETFETAAIRELKEELNLDKDDYSQLRYSESYTEEYAFSKDTVDITEAVFYATLLRPEKVISQDDSASVEYVSLEELDTVDFSLNRYPKIILNAYELLHSTVK